MEYNYFICEIALPKRKNRSLFKPDREYRFKELSNDYNQENESSFKRTVSSNLRLFGSFAIAFANSAPAARHGQASVSGQQRASEIMCQSYEARSAEASGRVSGISINKFYSPAYKNKAFLTSFLVYKAVDRKDSNRSPSIPSSEQGLFTEGISRTQYDFNYIIIRTTPKQAQKALRKRSLGNIDGIDIIQGDKYQVDFNKFEVVTTSMLKPNSTESNSFVACYKSQALAERAAREDTRNREKELLSQESSIINLGNRM